MPLGTRRRRGRMSKVVSEVVAHPSLAALKKNKKNKKRNGQSSWLTLEFAIPHGIGRGRRMWIAWASWQLQASLPIELHTPHSQPLAPITHYQHLVKPLLLLLPSSAMMSNQICSSLGIPSQTETERQTEPLAISLVMLKWVLGMASGMWVLLQHPRTHVFGIPSSSFPIRPSSSSLQTTKPPQQQQNPLPTVPPRKQKENGNNTTTTTSNNSSSNDFWFWSFFVHHNPQTLKHPKHNIDLDVLLRIINSLSFPSQSLVPPRLVFNFFFSTLKNQSNSLRITAPKKTGTKSDLRILWTSGSDSSSRATCASDSSFFLFFSSVYWFSGSC